LTRAFCSISHGHFSDAWFFNPFSYLFYPLTILLFFYPFMERRWSRGIQRAINSRGLGWIAVGLGVVMWGFAIWRIHLGWGSA